MTHFKVVLRGRGGRERRAGEPADSSPLRRSLEAYSVVSEWFLPEPVVVKVSRPRRSAMVPCGWELSLAGDGRGSWARRSRMVDRVALVTMAAAGMVAGVVGTARADEAMAGPEVATPPPSLESSSQPRYVPTDHPPRVVLVEAREVGASLDRFAPLTDAHGNPILIASYHSNTAGTPHTNAPMVNHTNSPWSNHSNAPAGHTDAAWSNHSNFPGQVHTNIVPGDFVF